MTYSTGLSTRSPRFSSAKKTLRAQDRLDRPADVEVVRPQPVRQGIEVGGLQRLLGQEQLADPPGQATGRRRVLEHHAHQVVALPATRSSRE